MKVQGNMGNKEWHCNVILKCNTLLPSICWIAAFFFLFCSLYIADCGRFSAVCLWYLAHVPVKPILWPYTVIALFPCMCWLEPEAVVRPSFHRHLELSTRVLIQWDIYATSAFLLFQCDYTCVLFSVKQIKIGSSMQLLILWFESEQTIENNAMHYWAVSNWQLMVKNPCNKSQLILFSIVFWQSVVSSCCEWKTLFRKGKHNKTSLLPTFSPDAY